MKNFTWKTEYSLTAIFVFAVILFLVPTSFTSKSAGYISKWNEKYNKIEYMFTAMTAQADAEIVKELKLEKDNNKRKSLMIKLIQPYLRLEDISGRRMWYSPHFMNGKKVPKKDFYYFDTLYKSSNGLIVGVKDIKNELDIGPAFMMMVDVNGAKRPNVWGRDIYGVDIYCDGKIKALGHDEDVDVLRKDCSPTGKGVFCSYFYRIGGEFTE